MMEYAQSLFSSEAYMPHGMCYLWEPGLLWLHVGSDLLIGLAYFAIPPALVYLVVKARREFGDPDAVPFSWMFLAFGVFIVACGTTHLFKIWTVWNPYYWAEGSIKAVTAAASMATAIALPPLVPRALQLLRNARASERRRLQLEETQGELAEANDRLKEHDRRKSEFFANVSHELRTPLTLILGPAELLLNEEMEDEEERTAKVEMIHRNARTLLAHVEELLEVARADAGALHLKPRETDLSRLVGVTVDRLRVLARERDIDFGTEIEETVAGRVDREKVEGIVVNLLSNAFKFTPEGGEIRLELTVEPEGGEGRGRAARLRIWDSGPGIPEIEREMVFERFHRGSAEVSRLQGGTGLGLSIVREFAELHGGEVAIDDGPLAGTRVTVRIPLDREEPPHLADPDPAPEEHAAGETAEEPAERPEARAEAVVERLRKSGEIPGSGREERDPGGEERGDPSEEDRARILVMEDNRDMAAYLEEILLPDWDVQVAFDGAAGLEAALREAPDLVLTDMMMPEMDGEELIRRIREHEELDPVPVVVLTARADDELPSRLLEMGAQDYVMKPARAGEIRARVRNLLELTRSRRRLQAVLGSEGGSLPTLIEEVLDQRARLTELADDKELLLRELHHRVKGNLQTIMSLINLQVRRIDDPGARKALEESRSRVSSMAILHEKLYRSDDPGRVEVNEYLKKLVAELVRSRGAHERGIRATADLDQATMEIDHAVAYGLILHELLANALTHGFPGEPGGGNVQVSFRSGEEGELLAVEDDGVGLPGDFDPRKTGSLGFELVTALTTRMGGEVSVGSGRGAGGTRIEVSVPPGRRNR